MRKLFTLTLILFTISSLAQNRGHIQSSPIKLNSTFLQNSKDDALFLYPGNWSDTTEAKLYDWGDQKGYLFGTNTFNDKGCAQIFNINKTYQIESAIFWFAAKEGATGNVKFVVWDYSNNTIGNILGSKTVPLADISMNNNLDKIIAVKFDELIEVSSSFAIGIDISGLDPYLPGKNELGLVSSEENSARKFGLSLLLDKDDKWVPILDYDVDVDIAIFPIVYEVASSTKPTILHKTNAYPNPFNEKIYIENALKTKRIIITNVIGQVVIDMPVNSPTLTIETSLLKQGIHLIIFENEDGTRVVRKMIKR